MTYSILVVDDEHEIADLIEVYLKNEGYQVYKFYRGLDAVAFLETHEVNLALLDVMLPDISGFALCQKLREKYLFPILMLTAKVEDMDKITGLTVGADDYMTKPFNPLEMVARVKTHLRRYMKYNTAIAPSKEVKTYDFDGFNICYDSRKAHLYGKELALTPIEFNILWFLCQNKGKVVASEQLFESVWGEKFLDNNNTVMAHIARLREKMNEPTRKPRFIKTVWGVGYTIE